MTFNHHSQWRYCFDRKQNDSSVSGIFFIAKRIFFSNSHVSAIPHRFDYCAMPKTYKINAKSAIDSSSIIPYFMKSSKAEQISRKETSKNFIAQRLHVVHDQIVRDTAKKVNESTPNAVTEKVEEIELIEVDNDGNLLNKDHDLVEMVRF